MDSDLGNKKVMARNIQKLLSQNNVSRKELAKAIGVPYTTVCGWISAKTYPRIDKVEMMANYFKVQKRDLVEDEYRDSAPPKSFASSSEDEDEEFKALINEMHKRREMKMLFKSVRGMNKEQIEAIANMADAFRERWNER